MYLPYPAMVHFLNNFENEMDVPFSLLTVIFPVWLDWQGLLVNYLIMRN